MCVRQKYCAYCKHKYIHIQHFSQPWLIVTELFWLQFVYLPVLTVYLPVEALHGMR